MDVSFLPLFLGFLFRCLPYPPSTPSRVTVFVLNTHSILLMFSWRSISWRKFMSLRVWHPKPSLPISSKFWQSCSWCKVNFLTAGSSCLPVVMTSFFSFLFTLLIQLLMSLAFESSSLDDIYFAWDSVAHTFLPNFLASSSELLDVKA